MLHLSEGTDNAAHDHFKALDLGNGQWAITPSLVGIHSIALTAEDFAIMESHGASMVWSPLSNLLLYGETADIGAAESNGINIGIGSDWAPSGSKNLLGELKVASLVSAEKGNIFTPSELIAMATRDAAKILNWDRVIGSVEQGKRADLLVIDGNQGDEYAHLINAHETDIALALIDGVEGMVDLLLLKLLIRTQRTGTLGDSLEKFRWQKTLQTPMSARLHFVRRTRSSLMVLSAFQSWPRSWSILLPNSLIRFSIRHRQNGLSF